MPPLQFLIVEDDDNDAVLLQNELRRAGFDFTARIVDQQATFRAALDEQRPDAVIADFRLPRFDALAALELLRSHARKTPFLVYAGALDDETAQLCVKLGAADCVPKQDPARLASALRAAFERRRLVEEKEMAVRAADQRFRVLAELAPVLIWQCDAQGRFHYFNRAWAEFAGTVPRDGAEWLEIVHPDDRPRCQQVLAEKLNTREPCQLELRLRRFDGEYRTILCQAAPLPDNGRGFGGFVGSGLDISERAPTPALRPGLRHEFNNRIAIIRMTADVLSEMSGLSPAAQQRAREISEATDYITELVRELPSSTPPSVTV